MYENGVKFSRGKLVLYLLGSLMFVAAGIFAVLYIESTRGKVAGWLSIIFFGFCALLFIKQFFTKDSRIVVDDEGIEDKSLEIGKILWSDIEAAYPNDIYGCEFICLKVRDVDKYLRRTSKPKQKLASFNERLGFETLNLNLVGLGVSRENLLREIEKHISDR